MSQLEIITDDNYEAFLTSGVRFLVLTLTHCPNCREWAEELETFLESAEEWDQVRFGKIDLESENAEQFKKANDWLEFVEGVPFNVIFVEGEPKVSFSGSGVARLVKRLQRITGGA